MPGPGCRRTFGGEVRTDTLTRIHQRGDRVQPVPHHGDVLADAGVAADRPQPSPDRQRADRRAGQRLGRLLRGDPEEQRPGRRGAAGTTATRPAAWGKWHNTPALETTPAGPFDNWPTGLGLRVLLRVPGRRGVAVRAEPGPQHHQRAAAAGRPEEGYHLSEDLADDAIGWLRRHQAFEPDKPFFMYWASGCLHGPHHVAKEWADKYAGKFDDGWDAYRERVYQRAKEMGWIPPEARADPARPSGCRPGTTSRRSERPFQRRLMEVAAGFGEHVDVQVGRLVDEIDALGLRRQHADLLHLGRQRLVRARVRTARSASCWPRTASPPRSTCTSRPWTSSAASTCWAPRRSRTSTTPAGRWAGSTPYKGMKLLASHFGGTRNPMAVRWPAKITPDRDAAHPVPPLQRRRPHDLRGRRDHPAAGGQRRPAGPDRRRQLRLHLRRRRRRGPAADPVLRGHGQPRDLPRRLDGLRVRPPSPVGPRPSARDRRLDPRPGHLGAVPPRRRTGPRPTTSPTRCPRSWRR